MRLMVVCLLAACNQVYGLDQTHTRDAFEQFPDRDQDGIADDRDNCRDDANASQSDGDVDGIGDACDHCDACEPCSMGALHDEDHDRIADGCDPCPTRLDNTDSDGDGIGDRCEHGASAQHRVFDGFFEPSVRWLERGARWQIEDDNVVVRSGYVNDRFEYYRTDGLPASTDWYVETAVLVSDVDGRQTGIYLNDSFFCFLLRVDATTIQIVTAGANARTFVDPGGPIRLRYAVTGAIGSQTFHCSVADANVELVAAANGLTYPTTIALFADRAGVSFSYFDLVAP